MTTRPGAPAHAEAMAFGPLELVVLTFPAEHFTDGARTVLRHLPPAGGMRVVDVVVVRADGAGQWHSVELSEVPGLCGLAPPASGLITQVDVSDIADLAEDGTEA